jgi:hypothetical protein
MDEYAREVPVDADVMQAVQEEVSQSRSTVREMETDAAKKGIPLELQGVRYRIYETTIPK